MLYWKKVSLILIALTYAMKNVLGRTFRTSVVIKIEKRWYYVSSVLQGTANQTL